MRKTLKWMVLGLLALVIMAAVGGYLMVRSAGHPKIDGDLKLTGLIYYALITEFKYKGLLLEDLTPKKQYYAYQFMGSQLATVEHVGPVTQFAGVEGQEFKQTFVRRLWILWSRDGSDQTITLPAGFVAAFDKYGNALPVAGNQLTVGWSPVYVQLMYRNE